MASFAAIYQKFGGVIIYLQKCNQCVAPRGWKCLTIITSLDDLLRLEFGSDDVMNNRQIGGQRKKRQEHNKRLEEILVCRVHQTLLVQNRKECHTLYNRVKIRLKRKSINHEWSFYLLPEMSFWCNQQTFVSRAWPPVRH